MPYREPAEDEEAKLDAEEVEAFRTKLATEARRQRRRELVWILGLMLFFVVFVMVAVTVAGEQRPPSHREGCHYVTTWHAPGGGAPAQREEILECPDAGTSGPRIRLN